MMFSADILPYDVQCCNEDTARTHPQHEAMFNVEENLLPLTVVTDEGVEGVTVRNPANQTRVSGQGDSSKAGDPETQHPPGSQVTQVKTP